ncbi:MAG TPA: AMP-binding protein, partial [Gemmatimonadaceae bacterium]
VLARGLRAPSVAAVTFLSDGDASSADTMTCGDLAIRIRAVAAYLASRGPIGSRAIVACPPGLDYVATFLGCMHAAWIPVPAPAPASARRDYRLGAIAADAGAALVFTTDAGMNAARRAAPELPWVSADDAQVELPVNFSAPAPDPNGIAFLQYTSGSTSEPKGVVVTHTALNAELEIMRFGTGLNAGETVVSWMPMYHDFGLVGQFLTTMWVGGHMVLMPPTAFLRRPSAWLRAASHYAAVVTAGPNFALDLCCRRVSGEERATFDLSALRTLACGGEPVNAETAARFASTFATCGLDVRALAPGYGMAETVLAVAALAPEQRPPARVPSLGVSAEGLRAGEARAPLPGETERRLVSCGVPMGGLDVRIVDPETRRPSESARVGEIWVAGANVAAGYWNREAETAEVFGARLADGTGPFLRTGDLGFVHNGSLIVTGRRKEMMIVRGHNHFPQDIERTALAADDALEPGGAAAFGVTVDGEEQVVLVHEVSRGARRHLDADVAMTRIRRAVSEAHGVTLHDVVLAEPLTVPKTSSGKVQRMMCRDQWMNGELEIMARHLKPTLVADIAEPVACAETSVNDVLTFIAEQTHRDRVAAGDELRGTLDLDSLALIELIVNVESRFEVKLSEETVANASTAGELASAVAHGGAVGADVIGIGELRDQIIARVPQIRVEVERQIGRELLVGGRWVDDFASANYLGLDLHSDVKDAVAPAIEKWGVHPSWTRIVASPAIYGELERKLAAYIGAPDTLVFPTVTLAHAGLLPLLAGSRGAIFVDNEAHASLQDGASLAATRGAHVIRYAHGDHQALESLLAASPHHPKIIATDG